MSIKSRFLYICFVCSFLLCSCGTTPTASPTPTEAVAPPTNTPLPPPTDTSEPPTAVPTLNELQSSIATAAAKDTPLPTAQILGTLGYLCEGEGPLTIIFETHVGVSGLTDDGLTKAIQAVHASSLEPVRTCRYSRKNLEGSEKTVLSQSSEQIITNLHRLILEASIPGPYILVGHGDGGMFAMHYQAVYPEDVLGLVLVSPDHPFSPDRITKAIFDSGQPTPTFVPTSTPDPAAAAAPVFIEPIEWAASYRAWQKISDLGDLPLVVISSTKPFWEVTDIVWNELEAELASWSTNSVHLYTPASFLIFDEDPGIVVQALEELVKMIQNKP